MFDSPVIDVALGLTLVYLLLSLIMTSAIEAIESVFRSRGRDLEQALAELLDDPGGAGLRGAFYRHPLIASLYRGAYRGTVFDAAGRRLRRGARSLPSYIPRQNFALAVRDLVEQGGVAPSERLRQAYDIAVRVSGGDPDKLRAELEGWFDSAMDRAAGWYKRRSQSILFWVGLAVAVVLNLNSVLIAQTIASNRTVRDALGPAAQSLLAAPAADEAGGPSEREAEDFAQRLQQTELAVRSVGLPIGWDEAAARRVAAEFPKDEPVLWPLGALKIALGYLATALAVTLGAPFWFDVLNKIMVIRSTVKPKEKSPDEASEDRQARPRRREAAAPAGAPAGDAGAAPAPRDVG